MRDDFRFALRQLRKNPGFAAIAVITLGLGIGAAAAMFGLIQGVLLSPPPYADPDRVMLVSPARTDGRPYTRGATIGQWVSWRQAKSIEPPAVYRWTFNFLVLPDGSQSMGGMVVTPSYFSVLGLRPMLGREFTDSRAWSSERATVGDHPGLRPLAAQVQRRPEHRRPHDPDEPHAGASSCRRRHAARHSLPARSGRVERAQLRPQRPCRFLVRCRARRVAADRRGRECHRTAERRCDGRPGADGNRGPVSRAGTSRRVASGHHRQCRAGAGRPQSRRPPPARSALRIGGARVLHRLCQRRRTATDAWTAASCGVRHALGARRRAMAALASGIDRESRPRDRRRRARRGTRERHHCICSRRLPGRRCRAPMPCMSAGPCFAFGLLAAIVAAGIAGLLPAARASLPGSIPGTQGQPHDRRPQRAADCSVPSRRCRSSSPSRSCLARRSWSARPATSIGCSPATTPRTSWLRRSRRWTARSRRSSTSSRSSAWSRCRA